MPTNPSLPARLKSYQEQGHERAKERTGISERLNLCFRMDLFREKSYIVCWRENRVKEMAWNKEWSVISVFQPGKFITAVTALGIAEK